MWYLNSIPLSLLSSLPGAESPPSVKIGSSKVTVVELTVVVVPLTVRLPVTVRLFPTVTLLGKPTVTVPELSATSTSFDVPLNVIVPPNDVAVVLLPSDTVIEEFASFEFAILPAN